MFLPLCLTDSTVPCPQGPARAADHHQTGLGIPNLDTIVHQLIDRGVAKSTLISYDAGKRRYLAFCQQFNLSPLPVCEPNLCRFVAFLFSSSLSYQSIRSYLSAVRHLQIVSGLPDPSLSSFSRLDYALKGIRRVNTIGPRLKRLPITPAILRQIYGVWSRDPPTFDRTMIWAAFCLGFFGFMRAGEFTCPSHVAFTLDMLAPEDVAVNLHSSPTHMSVHLKRSKVDPFGAGTTIHLGATVDILCPVTPCDCGAGVSGCAAPLTGPSVPVPRWFNPLQTTTYSHPPPSAPQCRHRRLEVQRPQLPHWCCNNCSSGGFE